MTWHEQLNSFAGKKHGCWLAYMTQWWSLIFRVQFLPPVIKAEQLKENKSSEKARVDFGYTFNCKIHISIFTLSQDFQTWCEICPGRRLDFTSALGFGPFVGRFFFIIISVWKNK